MNDTRVGLRFSPTGEELINFYLKNKILGNNWLVDDAISEIHICSYDPAVLPSLSKIVSNEFVWYFFSRNEYIDTNQRIRKRTTRSGFWKATGRDREIKEKRGNRGQIGFVKTLVYHEGRVPNGIRTDWVMYEYNITCLPPDQRTYVLCKLFYKGEARDLPSAGIEVRNLPSGGSEVGNLPSGGSEVGNFPSGSNPCPSFVSESSSVRATTLTKMEKPQQKLPSVQRPVVVDSDAVRAANFAKMYKLLENLPSTETPRKLNSHPAP